LKLELEKELAKLSAERAEVDKLTTSKELTQEQLQLIRDRLKDLATRIKFEPPEVQHLIIKQYLDIIVFDKAASHFKVQFHIDYPSGSDDAAVKILEKTIFVSLD
jgi:predicted ribosome quality control (RQC) complex YloA/Tae2 family protein